VCVGHVALKARNTSRGICRDPEGDAPLAGVWKVAAEHVHNRMAVRVVEPSSVSGSGSAAARRHENARRRRQQAAVWGPGSTTA